MNVQLPAHIDKPTFLAWVQGREGRYELVQGRVVMMTGASREHGKIVSNLVALLRSQIDLDNGT
jgi:Uma2 family endonuclease